jgi:hypothetical protein
MDKEKNIFRHTSQDKYTGLGTFIVALIGYKKWLINASNTNIVRHEINTGRSA